MSLSSFTLRESQFMNGKNCTELRSPPAHSPGLRMQSLRTGKSREREAKPDSVFGSVTPLKEGRSDGTEVVEVQTWIAFAVHRLFKGYKVVSKRRRPRQALFGRITYSTIYCMERDER